MTCCHRNFTRGKPKKWPKKWEKLFLNDLILGQYINACKLKISRFKKNKSYNLIAMILIF